MNIRQGAIGGTVIAVFASLSVGIATESVGMGFVTLAFTLLLVAGTVAIMARANRGRTNQ